MTPDQIEGLIKFAILVITPCIGITITTWKWIAYLEIKAKENSLGAGKIKEYEEFIREIKQKVNSLIERVEGLGEDYQSLIKEITKSFLNKS